MYATCLFCNTNLGANEAIETFPIGRRLAFDAHKGRLWVVCDRCGRWNLSPIDERWEAIEDCERRFRDTYVRVSTSNIGLARLTEGLELIRIGSPLRPEFAAWRYGTRFGIRRRRTHLVAASGLAAAAIAGIALGPTIAPALGLGAISIVVVPGVTSIMGVAPVLGVLAARDYVDNDRVVARLAHGKRALTVRARHMRDVELDIDPSGHATLVVPHDAGWATITGTPAIHATGVLVAASNQFGAPSSRVDDAVRQIEDAGDATGYLSKAAARSGWRAHRFISPVLAYRGLGALRLSSTERLALEMAVHEESERRAMQGELEALETAWRDAEEIAAICDEQLS